jgi:hypothetical protein
MNALECARALPSPWRGLFETRLSPATSTACASDLKTLIRKIKAWNKSVDTHQKKERKRGKRGHPCFEKRGEKRGHPSNKEKKSVESVDTHGKIKTWTPIKE